ncbi:uncharacterized protein LOC141718311 [Apium graveolens]|uniref:uncharacterized protein LOC141718311 n=1 Tax=Apium graveolens TaxID=4045 RepID=UPI003D78E1A4
MAKRSRLEWEKNKLGFEGLITVDPVGKSGGLTLMWKEKNQAELIGLSRHYIDVKVHLTDMNEWRLTGFYREPDRTKRQDTWNLLRNLAMNLYMHKPHDVHLTELELTGHQFTWERGRDIDGWMEIRLDRALINENWLNNFPMAKLYNLEGAPSDHSAILLVPHVLNCSARAYRLKFENVWLTEPMCEQLVHEGWINSQGQGIQEKIKICSDKLTIWGKEITGNFAGRIKECKANLRRFKNGRDIGSRERYNEAKAKLESIFNQREIFWRQRSKTASGRRRNNHIQKLQDAEGNWLDWDHGLSGLITNYFTNLFAATEAEWQEVVECVPGSITDSQNNELLRPVVEEEVKTTLFQMNPDKAPGQMV